ncbi:MAG: TrkH family potassium uptake protein [Spirochaetales bacterium]|nr:TrkH family potassium uptake protein [Spirochaetales bacterium]
MSKPRTHHCRFCHTLGSLLVLFSAPFLLSLLILPFEEASLTALGSLLLPAVILLLTGGGLMYRGKNLRDSDALSVGQACAAVVTAWIAAAGLSVLPIMYLSNLDITEGIYESVSGWTTTAFSLLDVSSAPRLLILFRGSIQFTGGLAAALMLATAFSFADGDIPLMTGPTEAPDGVYPRNMNLRRLFRFVCILYGSYFLLGLAALIIAGTGIFDAVIYSFSAVSTGGFTPVKGGMLTYPGRLRSIILMLLMFLGSMNVFIARKIIRGKVFTFLQNGEIRLFYLLTALGTLGLTIRSPGAKVLPSLFQVTSVITSTGFTLSEINNSSAFHRSLFLLLTAVGGFAGSAAGGIKLYRINQLLKGLFLEFRRFLNSGHRVIFTRIRTGIAPVELTPRDVCQSGLFVFLFAVCTAAGTLILTSRGMDLHDSLGMIISALGNNGLAFGSVSGENSPGVLWTQTGAMILGRFEFYILILGVAQLFKRKS